MKVVIADDAVLFREALASVLTGAGFEVCAQVGDARSVPGAIDATGPDLVVIDIRLPPTHQLEGLVAAVEIRRAHPGVGVLVLSQHLETRLLRQLVGDSARGVGYLLKERVSGIGDFVSAAFEVAAGGCAFDPEVVSRMTRAEQSDDRIGRLTEREREILSLIAEGRSNQAICAKLVLTKKTVESHVRSILLRLDLPTEPDDHRRVLAVLEYLRPWSEQAYRVSLPAQDFGGKHSNTSESRHR
ncbi:response regulator transcription factor [Amycolatopsis sp. NBC_00355]